MYLDIGCGAGSYEKTGKVRGQINCDISKPTKKIQNFCLCDAQNLPFKDKAFEKTYLFDVLEHVQNPTKALLELKRVSHKTILTVPNIYFLPKLLRLVKRKTYTTNKGHIHAFGKIELTNLLETIPTKEYKIFNGFYRKTSMYANYFRFFPKQFAEHTKAVIIW